MKQIKVIFLALACTLLASVNMKAQTADETKVLDAMVSALREYATQVNPETTQGVFKKITAAHDGKNIVMGIYFESNLINLKDKFGIEMTDQIPKEFMKGVLSKDDENHTTINFYKKFGLKFIFNFYDVHGNTSTKTLDPVNL